MPARPPICTIVTQHRRSWHVDLAEPPTTSAIDFEYLINVAKYLVQVHGVSDLDFSIVYDTHCDVPTCDNRTAVFIYGDEKCRLPIEFSEARLILSCYGIEPYFPESLSADVPSLLDYARYTKERLQSWRHRRSIGNDRYEAIAKKTLAVPLGYSQQRELPIKPIPERRYAASFAGSLRNLAVGGLSPKRLSGIPKASARAKMIEEIDRIRRRFPKHEFLVTLTDSFADSLQLGGEEYSKLLMDSVLCLAPRGTRMETWRVFEGLRYGCIVVSQALPDHWFYRGSPIIELASWRDLGELIEDLFSDPIRLEELHRRSLSWWRYVCSPEAVARRADCALRQAR